MTKTFGEMIPARISALSYSRIKTCQQCMFKAKCKFIDKLKEPDSPYAARGTKLHEFCATYLKTGEHVPPALSKVGLLLHNLREECDELDTELQVAVDKDWKQVSWFGPTVFMRVIWDVRGRKDNGTTSIIVDHKSGKVYDDHPEQLELYALVDLCIDSSLDMAEGSCIYIDQGFRSPVITVTRDQIPELKEKWEGIASKIMSDTIFAPTPHRFCKWCHYRRSNGGPCDHG